MLCLSGFELYSRWVPLWYHTNTSVSKFRAFLLIVSLRGYTVSLCGYG